MKSFQTGLLSALLFVGASAYAFDCPECPPPGECDPEIDMCDGGGGAAIQAASPEVTTPADTNLPLGLDALLQLGPGIEITSADLTVTGQPTKGTATVSQDGTSIIFSPNGEFNDLEYGATFAVIFDYDVALIEYTDNGTPATWDSPVYGPVTVTVTSTGTPPPPPAPFAATTLNLTTDKNTDLVIGDDETLFTVDEGHTMTGTTLSVVGETQYGQLTINNENGTITFSSNGDLDHLQANDQPEVISFKYRVADISYEGNDVVEGTINITVNGVDDAPADQFAVVKPLDVVWRDGALNDGEFILLAVSIGELEGSDRLEITDIPDHLTFLEVYGGSNEQQDIAEKIRQKKFKSEETNSGLIVSSRSKEGFGNAIAQLLFKITTPDSAEVPELQIRHLNADDNTIASTSVALPSVTPLPALFTEIGNVVNSGGETNLLVSLMRTDNESAEELFGDWLFTLADQSSNSDFACDQAKIDEDASRIGDATSSLSCNDAVLNVAVSDVAMSQGDSLALRLDFPDAQSNWELSLANDAGNDFVSTANALLVDNFIYGKVTSILKGKGDYAELTVNFSTMGADSVKEVDFVTVQLFLEAASSYPSDFICSKFSDSDIANEADNTDAFLVECNEKMLTALVVMNKEIDAEEIENEDKVFTINVETGGEVGSSDKTVRFFTELGFFTGDSIQKVNRQFHKDTANSLGFFAALMSILTLLLYRRLQSKK